jgi:type IV secretory pathway ATPase VirB11/archaellum biosynthesis ATPase
LRKVGSDNRCVESPVSRFTRLRRPPGRRVHRLGGRHTSSGNELRQMSCPHGHRAAIIVEPVVPSSSTMATRQYRVDGRPCRFHICRRRSVSNDCLLPLGALVHKSRVGIR